jgi:hypothetical protein
MSPSYTHLTKIADLSPQILAADLNAVLARAERQLAALGPRSAARPLATGKWSSQQTVGHLIDSCNNNLHRLIRLQLSPRLAFPGYQQDKWVNLQRYDRRPWPDVVALFLALNRHFAHTVQYSDPKTFTHVWVLNGQSITLGFLLVDYIEHLEHHLRQIPHYSLPT